MTERYQRHGLIDWFDQEKLRDARIVVVGAGAVGNEVLKNLTLLGIGHIHILDFDKIEEHNLTRCVLFREADIGQHKADVAASACRLIDPNVEILASNVDFWKGLSLGMVDEADAVVCCVDNFEARIGLNQLCSMTGTDFYNTGIDSRYSSVELFPFSTRPDCACYQCPLPASVYTAIQRRYSCGPLRKVAFAEKKIPTTTITSSLAGAVVASMMLNRISSHAQALQDAVRHFQDSISLESTVSLIQRKEDCPACTSVDPQAIRLTAKRSCACEPIIPLADACDGDVVLSEPVLIRGTCKLCERHQDYYESARQITDAVTYCSVCSAQSVSTELVEKLPLAEFEKTFAGRSLPCKFLAYHADNRQIIVEMED